MLLGNYGNYDVKVRVQLAKWRSQRLLTSAQFLFTIWLFQQRKIMTKVMNILILGPTISVSSSRYFSRVDLSVCKYCNKIAILRGIIFSLGSVE